MSGCDALLSAENTAAPDAGYEAFKQGFAALSGIRLDLYKENQMKRRIDTLIARTRVGGYEPFLALLTQNPVELASFIGYITINVTEFFRTPDHWSRFESEALPALLCRGGAPLKIWSCACATGEEPYSLAMSLLRVTEPSRFHILATDLDGEILQQAEQGIYGARSTGKLPAELCERYFTPCGGGLRVSDTLRGCVSFQKLDLLREDFPQDCDLAVCRNVLIYFTEAAKDEIYGKLADCLAPGGFLFTGNTEQIVYYKKYGLKKLTGYLYQKP